MQYPGRVVRAQVWRAQVGRVPLYLLDTNIEDNRPEDRDITDQLYGGDHEMRIRQEIVLGIGGIRALEALGLRPTVCHMNEGHSAFLALERIRLLMEEHKLSFAEAREAAAAGNVFTTHTPVPAGIDWFHPDLVDRYFQPLLSAVGPVAGRVPGPGAAQPQRPQRLLLHGRPGHAPGRQANGVSQLHGRVSREMWQEVWPQVPAGRGADPGHHQRRPRPLLDLARHGRPLRPLPGAALGRAPGRARLSGSAWRASPTRSCGAPTSAAASGWWPLPGGGCAPSWSSAAAGPSEIRQAEEVLDPEALTIGFARRFATYKRATLLFRDLERLARIVGDTERPVQIIFAGKAHPRDNPGKELIRQIVHHARRAEFRNRIVFLEDYDMAVARYLVQGVDVWLNTPRRPREASGTSGMKAAANGGLNLSILDGWWDEGYTPETGWAIGRGEEYDDDQLDYQDTGRGQRHLRPAGEGDRAPLLRAGARWAAAGLDRQDEGRDARPRRRLQHQPHGPRLLPSSATCPQPSASQHLRADDLARAKALAAWKARVAAAVAADPHRRSLGRGAGRTRSSRWATSCRCRPASTWANSSPPTWSWSYTTAA